MPSPLRGHALQQFKFLVRGIPSLRLGDIRNIESRQRCVPRFVARMKRSVIRGLVKAVLLPDYRNRSSTQRWQIAVPYAICTSAIHGGRQRHYSFSYHKAAKQETIKKFFVAPWVTRAIHALAPSGPALQQFAKRHGAVLNSVAGLCRQVSPRDGAHKFSPGEFVVRDISSLRLGDIRNIESRQRCVPGMRWRLRKSSMQRCQFQEKWHEIRTQRCHDSIVLVIAKPPSKRRLKSSLWLRDLVRDIVLTGIIQFELFLPARRSSAVPRIADSMDAEKTAIFAAAKSSVAGKACEAMNSDMVKPMPASAPAPASCSQV
jgi:hypothetical protein